MTHVLTVACTAGVAGPGCDVRVMGEQRNCQNSLLLDL